MVDLASLAIKVDTTGAKEGSADLDKLATSAAKAEGASDRLSKSADTNAKSMKTASQAAAEMARSVQDNAAASARYDAAYAKATKAAEEFGRAQLIVKREIDALDKSLKAGTVSAERHAEEIQKAKAALSIYRSEYTRAIREFDKANIALDQTTGSLNSAGRASRAMGAHAVNLSRQMTDVAQGFALGQAPMQIFLQQGFQISEVLALMSAEAKKTNTSLTGMALNMAKGHPVMLLVAAAAGAIAGGIGLMTKHINDNQKVQVTWADTALGTFDVIAGAAWDMAKDIGNAISDGITGAFEAMGIDIGNVWDAVVKFSHQAANMIIAALVVVPKTVGENFAKIPAAIGDVFYSGVGAAIDAINSLARRATQIINDFIAMANAIPGVNIGGVNAPQFNAIGNPYAGGLAALGSGISKSVVQAFSRDFVTDFGNAVREAATARAVKRKAEEGGKGVGRSMGKAAGAAAREAWQDEAARLIATIDKTFGAAFAAVVEANNRAFDAKTVEDYDKAMKAANDNTDNLQKGLRKAADEHARWNEQIGLTVGFLQQIGGFAGTVGNILAVVQGITSGNVQNIPGKAGGIIGLLSQSSGGRDIIDGFENVLKKVFDPGGTFGETLNGVFQNVGAGLALSNTLFGGSSGGRTGSNIGAGIGGIAMLLGASPATALLAPLVGGLWGSALSPTKRGSATFGASGLVSTRGNSSSRIGTASDLGGQVQGALATIANAFGATIGDYSFSVGVRKDNLRFDPTGQGITKTSNGAIDFGQDEAGLFKAALAHAAKSLEGLSEQVQNLINGSGDFEAQLQKATLFQGALDELARIKDPLGSAMGDLESQFDNLRSIFDEAGASAEQLAQLEELYGLKRKDIAEQYASDALETERSRRELEIQILELQGKSAEALASARQLELDGMDESLRPLKERIFALQDEAIAAAEAARIASEREALEVRLLQVQGDTNALRERELSALDPSNQALMERIFALQDEAEALAATARQEQEAANLRIRLASTLGDEEEALRLTREQELAAIDPLNAALLQMIYTAEDAAAVQNALAQAQANAAQAAQSNIGQVSGLIGGGGLTGIAGNADLMAIISGLGSGASVADAAGNIRGYLTRQLGTLGISGDLAGAAVAQITGAGGSMFTNAPGGGVGGQVTPSGGGQAGIDAQLSLIRSQSHDQQAPGADKQAEQDAKIADIKNRLLAAYEREAGILNETINRLQGFRDTLQDFVDSLKPQLQSPAQTYRSLQVELMKQLALAAGGNEDAYGALPGAGNSFLAASATNASTLVQYQRDVAFVMREVGGVIGNIDDQIDYQEAQLAALDRSVQAQIETKEAVETTNELLRQLNDQMSQSRDENVQLSAQVIRNTANTHRVLDRTSQGGLAFGIEEQVY